MKKLGFFILVLCLAHAGKAQVNLVINPQFEIYDTCPPSIDGVTYCLNWNSLDSSWRSYDYIHDLDGVPEYVNKCSPGAGVTLGSTIYQRYHSDSGMMQVQMFTTNPTTDYFRDYLQGHLLHPLVAGHNYHVGFYTLREYISGDAVSHIGAYMDNGTIDSTHHPCSVQSQFTPQIVDTNIISDSANWTKIEGTFTAIGNEHLITIGQFTDSAHTHFYPVTSIISTGNYYSWYFVDDVSVIDCDNIPHAGNDTVIHPSDSAFIGTHEPLLPYKWYKLGSSAVIDSSGGMWVKPTVTTSYILEQKLCGITKMDTIKIWVWPDTPTSVGSQQLVVGSLMVYPNPVTNEVTVEGAKGCEVAFYDVTGRAVLMSSIATDKQALDISALVNGVYLIQVTDESTGARAIKTMLKE